LDITVGSFEIYNICNICIYRLNLWIIMTVYKSEADDDNTIFHSALICVTEENNNMCIWCHYSNSVSDVTSIYSYTVLFADFYLLIKYLFLEYLNKVVITMLFDFLAEWGNVLSWYVSLLPSFVGLCFHYY